MLTVKQCENAPVKDKDYKLADSGGLFLNVRKTGAKVWRLKYRHPFHRNPKTGKLVERLMTIGSFPTVSLADARKKREEAKELLLQKIDPIEHQKAELIKKEQQSARTFEMVGREWHSHNLYQWEAKNGAKILRTLEINIFPYIGHRPISELTAQEILQPLKRVEAKGSLDQAARLRQRCGAIFRYAIIHGWLTYNPVNDLQGALKVYQIKHYKFLRVAELSGFYSDLEVFQCHPVVKLALRMVILSGLRTDELRGGRWDEVDFERKEWRVAEERTKMKRAEHIVPLSQQAIGLLEELQEINGAGEFIFSIKNKRKPMSDGAMIKAIYDMGYKGRTTVHGFRSTFSTAANEHEWREDVVEAQLSHKESGVRAAYNHALYLSQRHELMQWYADLIDQACKGADVIPITRKQA